MDPIRNIPNPDAGHSNESNPKVYFPNSPPLPVATARQTVEVFLTTPTAWQRVPTFYFLLSTFYFLLSTFYFLPSTCDRLAQRQQHRIKHFLQTAKLTILRLKMNQNRLPWNPKRYQLGPYQQI